jgi:hypothetical protein
VTVSGDLSVNVEGTASTLEATQVRLREVVEALSAIERRATTKGERRSAEWVTKELGAAGASEIRLSHYKAHSTWAVTLVAHSVLVLGGSLAGDLIARAIAPLAAVSLEADATGRRSWLRKLLPGKRRGLNVQARIPAPRGARRTVVVVAHRRRAQRTCLASAYRRCRPAHCSQYRHHTLLHGPARDGHVGNRRRAHPPTTGRAKPCWE